MDVRLSCFGALRVEDPQRGVLSFHGRKTGALLVYLAVEAGQPHSREMLAGLLWPELPEPDARNNLRVALARLSSALAGGAVQGTRHSVQLEPGLDLELDAARFEQLIAETRRHPHPHRSDCVECHPKLIRAIELYRGDFLQDFHLDGCTEFEEWQLVRRERYHLQAVEALADLSDFYENAGDYALAERFARQQIALEPLREEGHRRLMRLLYYQHQRSAALGQFQTCQRLLRQELGVEPEEETLKLYRQIEVAALPLPAAPAPQPAHGPNHNLPANLTPFVGREAELAELTTRLHQRDYRLLSVVGPGGMGKTRLAQEVARQQAASFRDGARWVPLSEVKAAQDIPSAIAQSLELSLRPRPSAAEQVLAALRDKELLLLLDNFEHPTEGVEFLAQLLQQAPRTVLLVTSRERLRSQAEDMFALQGLPVPELTDLDGQGGANHFASVQLFIDRARRIHKAFHLAPAGLGEVAHICRLLRGMPLAIELAAGWVQEYSPGEIAVQLTTSPDLLRTELRDVAPQHRSLRAVFERSWQLLGPDEQAALRTLAVFRGGFSKDAAEAVGGIALRTLHSLTDKSLLQRTQGGRFEQHLLVRELSEEQLDAAQGAEARQRHAGFYLDFLGHWGGLLLGERQGEARSKIGEEIQNIRAAWDWALQRGEGQALQTVVIPLHNYFDQIRGNLQALEYTADLSPLPAETPAQRVALAQLLCARADRLMNVGRFEEAGVVSKRASGLLGGLHHPDLRLRILQDNARLAYAGGDLGLSKDRLQEALGLAREGHQRATEATCLGNLALVEAMLGNYQASERCHLEVVALDRQLGNHAKVIHDLGNYGSFLSGRGRPQEARRVLEEALHLARQHNVSKSLDYLLRNLGDLCLGSGQLKDAEGHFQEALKIARPTGDATNIGGALTGLAMSLHPQGRLGQADAHLREALSLVWATREMPIVMEVLIGWGDHFLHAGQPRRAAEILELVIAHKATKGVHRETAKQIRNRIDLKAKAKGVGLEALVDQLLSSPKTPA